MPQPGHEGAPLDGQSLAYWSGYLHHTSAALATLLRGLSLGQRMVAFADALALLDGEAPKGAPAPTAPPAPKPAPVTPKPARPAPRRGLSPADVAAARRIARDVDAEPRRDA